MWSHLAVEPRAALILPFLLLYRELQAVAGTTAERDVTNEAMFG